MLTFGRVYLYSVADCQFKVPLSLSIKYAMSILLLIGLRKIGKTILKRNSFMDGIGMSYVGKLLGFGVRCAENWTLYTIYALSLTN